MTSWYRLRMMFPVQTSKNTSRKKMSKNTWQPTKPILDNQPTIHYSLRSFEKSTDYSRILRTWFSAPNFGRISQVTNPSVKSVELHLWDPRQCRFPQAKWGLLKGSWKTPWSLKKAWLRSYVSLKGMALAGVPINPPSRSSLWGIGKMHLLGIVWASTMIFSAKKKVANDPWCALQKKNSSPQKKQLHLPEFTSNDLDWFSGTLITSIHKLAKETPQAPSFGRCTCFFIFSHTNVLQRGASGCWKGSLF